MIVSNFSEASMTLDPERAAAFVAPYMRNDQIAGMAVWNDGAE